MSSVRTMRLYDVNRNPQKRNRFEESGDGDDDDYAVADSSHYSRRQLRSPSSSSLVVKAAFGSNVTGYSGWSNTATLHTPQQSFDVGVGFRPGVPSSSSSGNFGVRHTQFAGDGGIGDDHDNGVITNIIAVADVSNKAYRQFQLLRDSL